MSSLKKFAQMGLLVFVLFRALGLIEFSYQTYLVAYGLATFLVIFKDRNNLDIRDKIYLSGYIFLLIVPYGSASGIKEDYLITSGLIAFTLYSLTQIYWGPRWPLDLLLEAKTFGSKFLNKRRQPAKGKNVEKQVAPQQQFVGKKNPAPRVEQPTEKAKPAYVPEPVAVKTSRIANLNAHNGKPFGYLKKELVAADREDAKSEIFSDLNAAKKDDSEEALESALRKIENVLGADFKANFEKEFLAA